MSRRRTLMVALIGCYLLLGGKTIGSAAPAVASSTAQSRTAPRDLTKQFPLGPKRLCCQSQRIAVTHRRRASVEPGDSRARLQRRRVRGGSPPRILGRHPRAFWIILGAVVAGLVVVGIADLRRGQRESPRARPPGVTAAGYLERARAAADLVSRAHREPRRRRRLAVPRPPDGAAQERRHRERPRTVEELVYRRAVPLDRSRGHSTSASPCTNGAI